MREQLIVAMVALPALGIVNSLYFGNELRRFVEEVPTISSTIHIERFKLVVARQMYAALAQIVILGLPPLIFFFGIVRHQLQPSDILFVILPSAVVLLAAYAYKKVETAAKNIPTTDEQLQRERDRIVQVWLKKPLPDW